MAFTLQVIILIIEGTEKSESNYYSLCFWDRLPSYLLCYYVAGMEKVAELFSIKYFICDVILFLYSYI